MNQQPLRFYKIMDYPTPTQKEFFYFKKKIKDLPEINSKKFSRAEKTTLMEEYTTYIKKYRWLYSSLPFIEQVYLCNSITFNAVHKNSDIDLFFICKPGAIRRARFFSVAIFTLLNIKRNKKNIAKKFCLTFYITSDNQELSDIKIENEVYLPYRITHLVLLHADQRKDKDTIYIKNQRVNNYLPNFKEQQSIFVGIQPTIGENRFKGIIEKILGRKVGNQLEKIIEKIRKPLVIRKRNKLKSGVKYIIIRDNMLKFYQDKREDISENFYNKPFG